MIKYLQDQIPLTQDDRERLFKNGQQVYEKVMQEGGFIRVFCQRELPPYLIQDDWVTFYQNKLIAYEYQQVVEGSCIRKPYYMSSEDTLEIYNEISLAWLKNSVSVLTIDSKALEMISKMFEMAAIQANHRSDRVHIAVEQSANSKNEQQELIMQNVITLQDYFDKIKDVAKSNSLEDPKILTASISLNPSSREMKYLRKFLPKSLRPQSHNDALSYLRTSIRGANLPMLSIHSQGNWKKGNQGNLGENEIHCNLGPDYCLWITVDQENIPKLRNLVKQQYGFDILTEKRVWFSDPDFFLINSVPFKYNVQNKGDVMILGAGSLCWIKSHGFFVSASWSQVVLNESTLNVMSERHQIHQELNIQSSLPYKNLILDLYLHEKDLEQHTKERLQRELIEFFSQESMQLQLFEKLNSSVLLGNRNVVTCTKCGFEIFNYFHQKDNENYCLTCIKGYNGVTTLQISQKYRYNCLHYLLQNQAAQCNTEFCSKYQGKTKCTMQNENSLLQTNNQKPKLKGQLGQLVKGAEKNKQTNNDKNDEKSIQVDTTDVKAKGKQRKQNLEQTKQKNKKQKF